MIQMSETVTNKRGITKEIISSYDQGSTYWMYSMLTLAFELLDMALEAFFDRRRLAGQGFWGQRSTTCTSIVPCLHGLLVLLKHVNLYFLPQAAPVIPEPLRYCSKHHIV